MNWQKAINTNSNEYNLPGDWLKIEYFEALNILFRIENSLRMFVYIILKNEFHDKWKDLSITSDDEETSTINAIARKRISQDKNYAYLGYVINSPLLHLTSGELIRIITSESYWKLFKSYFLGTKEIMKNKLDEIGNVRNSVAHFRPIKSGDIEVIKQNSIHTLSEIEKTISDFITCSDIVPTNTEEQWYKEIITIGTEECKISFRQSKKEEWIKILLSFRSPILSRMNAFKGFSIKTLNLKVNQLLNSFSDIAKHTICVTESVPFVYIKGLENVDTSKQIRFTLGKKTLETNYGSIKKDLELILLQVSKEIALIKEDNLARGKLIEVVNLKLEKQGDGEGQYCELKNDPLKTIIDDESPVEFWGALNYSTEHFITDTDIYPWMPVDISEDKSLPF